MTAKAFLTGLLLAVLAPAAFADGQDHLAPGEHWLAATLNHRDAGLTVLVYQPPSGTPRFRVLDLDGLGIPYSADRFLRHRSENYVLADALTKHEVHLDPLMGRAHFVTRIRPHKPENVPADLLLDVRINGVLVEQPLYVKNTGTDLFFPAETLEQLRIALPEAYGPFLEDGMPVHALAGEMFYLALDRLYLELTVPAGNFVTTRLSNEDSGRDRQVEDWSPSIVLGYNASGGEDITGEQWHAGLADLAISAGTVGCRSRHLVQSRQERSTRLDSACRIDWPGIPLTAGIGDHYTSAGSLQQTVAYGGFWIGTDFSLQPYRNLQPSLIVDGNARLPSTLEIWMDQRLGLRQDIPPGPFVVDNLPAVTGSGELRAILVNATGRQVIVSAPVYSDPQLLGPGIVDWRVEGGRLRPGEVGSDDIYTERFGALTARAGVTDWLTGEIHAEGTEGFSAWSASSAIRIGQLGLLQAGVSESRTVDDKTNGRATLLAYSWRGDYLHAAFREIRRDASYISLGYPEPGLAPSRERVVSAGLSVHDVGLTLTGVERSFDNDESRSQQLANATLSFRLGGLGQLLLTATRELSSEQDTSYGLHLSIPLGRRSHAYHSMSGEGEAASSSTGYSLSPPPGSGMGMRLVRDTAGEAERYHLHTSYRGALAEGSVSGQYSPDAGSMWDAGISGAIIASRAGISLSRDDGNSFAMIETGPGVGDVGVLRENLVVAATNANGAAVVSGLRPYQGNRIGLRLEDLPLSSEIDTSELTVVPGRRSVVVAEFGFRKNRQLVARLELPAWSTNSIPAGSRILVDGKPAGLVGFDGTIYLTLPDRDHIVIEARWPTGGCTATVAVPAGSGIHEAGDITCHPQ